MHFSHLLPVAACLPLLAQDPARQFGYKLDFGFRTLERQKPADIKRYSMVIQKTGSGSIRVGDRVPITSPAGELKQYVDVGVNIDVRLFEHPAQPWLRVELESSSLGDAKGAAPIIRSVRSKVETPLVTGKLLPLVELEDPGTGRRYQIEVTATAFP